MSRWTVLFAGLVLGAGAALLIVLFALPAYSVGLIRLECDGSCLDRDAIAIAASLGRLDIVSLVLGFVGLGVAAFAIWGFVAIRETAVTTAKQAAEDIADEKASEIAADKVQTFLDHLQGLLKEHGVDIDGETVVGRARGLGDVKRSEAADFRDQDA